MWYNDIREKSTYMDYTILINNWCDHNICNVRSDNFMSYLVDLFNYLHKNKMKKEDLDVELANKIVEKFKIDDLLDEFQVKYQNIMLFYIKHLSKILLLDKNQLNRADKIDRDCRDCQVDPSIIINIDIDSLPDKEIDLEFMKQIGLENEI